MGAKEDAFEKGKAEREYMERVGQQDAAEAEALRLAKVVKGEDLTKYKDLKYKKNAARKKGAQFKQGMPDKQKLAIMRSCQFLIGFVGLVGTGIIFFSLYTEELMLSLSISRDFAIEIELVLLGSALTLAGIIGMIGFQHKHDTISERIAAEEEIF
jgi:hypothetical protein